MSFGSAAAPYLLSRHLPVHLRYVPVIALILLRQIGKQVPKVVNDSIRYQRPGREQESGVESSVVVAMLT